MVIAIDGPAGAGKSTVARGVAEALGFTYLDSGAMYRSVALSGLRAGADLDSAEQMAGIANEAAIGFEDSRVTLDDDDVTDAIREPDVTAAASKVSVHEGVRAALVERQRALIESADYVAEGRDIGTVVSPDAPLKIYLNASAEERARRRAEQIGRPVEEVMAAQSERDDRDREREHGALRAAEDAIELDTTGLAVGEVVARVVELARERGLA